MKRLWFLAAFMSYGNAIAVAQIEQPEAVEIPLKEIWAYEMPGTRDVQDLVRDEKQESSNDLWTPIIESLSEISPHWPRKGQVPRKGFAVQGTGLDALRGAYHVFAMRKEPQTKFTERSKSSIAFFSYQMGSYVHIRDITRKGSVIRVQYEPVGHTEKLVTSQFALIPLGNLLPGEYHVEIAQSLPTAPRSVEFGRRFVCQSFAFEITSENERL